MTVLERDGWRCVEWGGSSRLEVDHIQPLWKGGLEELDSRRRRPGSGSRPRRLAAAWPVAAGMAIAAASGTISQPRRPSWVVAVRVRISTPARSSHAASWSARVRFFLSPDPNASRRRASAVRTGQVCGVGAPQVNAPAPTGRSPGHGPPRRATPRRRSPAGPGTRAGSLPGGSFLTATARQRSPFSRGSHRSLAFSAAARTRSQSPGRLLVGLGCQIGPNRKSRSSKASPSQPNSGRIDMFPVWGTLLANKTGRCPKWPRPK